VTRGLWESVGEVLKKGVSDTQRTWAVKEASKTASCGEFRTYILPHCIDDQLDSVLTTLVTRSLWESVDEVLKRGVSDAQREWAVIEAIKYADDGYIEFFLHKSKDDLDSVLTILIKRRLWKSVGQVLKRQAACVEAKEQQCKDKTSYPRNHLLLHSHGLPHLHFTCFG
jgi:Arc/MetJ-type ribon-helix-helix transcriptional regulator